MKPKLIRITTVPISLDKLLEGQLSFMSSYFKVIAVSSNKVYLEKVGKRENVAVFELALTRKITPLTDIIALIKLYKFLRREKPSIVHSHTPKAGIIGMLAARLANVPNRLHTVAGLPLLEAKGVKRILLNSVEKCTYACATKVYPNSFGLKEIIRSNNLVNSKKLTVIANGSSNGIDTTYFNPQLFSEEKKSILKKQLGIKKETVVFIFIGRLVGDKGINELVAAFKNLQKQQATTQQLKLLLVGDFEKELDPLEMQTINEIENNQDVIHCGWQDDVRPYLAVSTVLTFPSYREGFPNVVMQAGAMGLPSIVSNINGCNEIIIEGENGLIIPVKNVEALLEAMKKSIVEKKFRDAMAKNSRTMIVNRYNQQQVWEALLDEYSNLKH